MAKKQFFNVDPSNEFGSLTLSHKFDAKPVNSNKALPKFTLTGGWSEGGKWKNEGIAFNIVQRPKTENVVITPKGKELKQIENTTGIQTTSGWIDKQTLNKSANTLLGMNKQVDQFGNVVRGNNYANPDFYAYEQEKERKSNLKNALPESIKQSNVLMQALGLKDKDGNIKQPRSTATNKRGDSVVYGGVKKRNRMRRIAREKAMRESLKTNPMVVYANKLLAEIEKPKIGVYNQRIGAGKRYRTLYTADPEEVINDYYLKTGVIDYAKGIDPEHAKLDPERKVTIVDTETAKRVPRIWCHNSRCRVTGYDTVYKRTYKDVLLSSRPKFEQMDALYGKIMAKSKEKKKKYGTYYELDADTPDYAYYGISDDSFASYESYKQNLISSIDARRENQEYIIQDIGTDTKSIDKKDRSNKLIPELEKTAETLDAKASTLKQQVADFDWQSKIRKETFGSDTITGDSHVGYVLGTYDGQVRGGNYYVQDVGRLIKKTKQYEEEMELQIKDKTKEIEDIKPDQTEGLVDFYTDVRDEEYAKASKTYLTKSLDLTRKEREQLEKSRKAQAFGSNTPAISIYKPQQSKGRPSLKSFSRKQYNNNRTRGGQNTLGGLVI